MMEVNPLCNHFTFHPSLGITVSTFGSVQPICHQAGKDEWGGVMDRDVDRYSEEEHGRISKEK